MSGEPVSEHAADEEAHAADKLEHAGPLPDGVEPLEEHPASLLYSVKGLLRVDDGERLVSYGADERVAAEGGAVDARPEALANGAPRDHRADGEAACEALRGRHDVGPDAVGHVGVEVPGPAVSGLDLIEDEERMVFVAELAGLLHELLISGDDAALALYRLHDYGAGLLGDMLLKGLDVVEWEMGDLGRAGAEALRVLVLAAY